jgi:hypothetical protein
MTLPSRSLAPLARPVAVSWSLREGVTQMSLMCSIATCKAKAGMCTHEKMTAGVIALLVVGFVVAKGLSLF